MKADTITSNTTNSITFNDTIIATTNGIQFGNGLQMQAYTGWDGTATRDLVLSSFNDMTTTRTGNITTGAGGISGGGLIIANNGIQTTT